MHGRQQNINIKDIHHLGPKTVRQGANDKTWTIGEKVSECTG